MTTYHIFYSWQSDIKQNDKFIEGCLADAIVKIGNTKTEYKIDRYTLNRKGTPDIPNTVFNKISNEIDIFISDITLINKKHKTTKNKLRLTPNPNVLLELGYAASAIRWDNIICVINTACGRPDLLPFDIKYRKPTEFNLPEKCTIKHQNLQREKLTEEFVKVIQSLNPSEKKYRLREITNILLSDDWNSIGATSIDDKDWGTLKISHEINNVFKFDFTSKTNIKNGDWTWQLYLNNDFFYSGKINWELNNKTSYGFKEFFIDERDDYYYLYLFPINLNQGNHGREVFKRKK